MALDSTVGGNNSNAYLTEAEADEYMATRLHAAVWSSASSADKVAAIIWATRLLDQMNWKGSKADSENALRWPRSGTYDRDGEYYDDDIIPKFLKDATAEYALQLLSSDLTATPETAGISRIKAGSVEMDIDKYDRPSEVPNAVNQLVSFVLESSGSDSFLPVVRT